MEVVKVSVVLTFARDSCGYCVCCVHAMTFIDRVDGRGSPKLFHADMITRLNAYPENFQIAASLSRSTHMTLKSLD